LALSLSGGRDTKYEIRTAFHAACPNSPPPLAQDEKDHHGGDDHNQKNFTLTKQYSLH
jgi:hypothetical protein